MNLVILILGRSFIFLLRIYFTSMASMSGGIQHMTKIIKIDDLYPEIKELKE